MVTPALELITSSGVSKSVLLYILLHGGGGINIVYKRDGGLLELVLHKYSRFYSFNSRLKIRTLKT